MKKPKSGISYIKVIGAITLCLYLALSFSPSKALAVHVSFSSGDSLVMYDDKGILSPKRCSDKRVSDSSAYTPATLYDEECCGDEVRLEVDVDATQYGNKVIFDGDTKLFEGSSCHSNSLEDTQGFRVEAEIGGETARTDFRLRDHQNEAYGTLYFEAY